MLDATLNRPKWYSIAALLHPDLATEFEALQDRLHDRILTIWLHELNARRGHGGLIRWFKLNFGLDVSTADDTIEKNKSLRYFDFEGERHDQLSHVEVRDGVKPSEVGRIHFPFDKNERRLIVDHVALKLYGV